MLDYDHPGVVVLVAAEGLLHVPLGGGGEDGPELVHRVAAPEDGLKVPDLFIGEALERERKKVFNVRKIICYKRKAFIVLDAYSIFLF